MPHEYRGEARYHAPDRLAIVVSAYNQSITGRLLQGALGKLEECGVPDDVIDVVWVPGAWELPAVVHRMAATEDYRAVIALGCVIEGETTHDRHINRQVSLALGELAREFALPISFGLLTCRTMDQALQRAGGNYGNKGSECAQAALEMIDLYRRLPAAH